MLDLKAWIDKVTNALKADYVVEQGTSGIWTYRKWNSGVAECWGKTTGNWSVNTSSAAYGGYRSTNISIPTFPFTFTANPTLVVMCNTASGSWVNNAVSTTTGGSFYFSAGSSMAAANRTVSFHAIGKWK